MTSGSVGGDERAQRDDASVGVEDPPVDLVALLGGHLEAQAALLGDAVHGRELEPGQGGVDGEVGQLDRPPAVVGVLDGDHGAVVLAVVEVEPHLRRPVVGDLEGLLGPADHLDGAGGARGRADLDDLLRVGGSAGQPGPHEQVADGDDEHPRVLGGVAGLVAELDLDRVAAVAQVEGLLDHLAPPGRGGPGGDLLAVDAQRVRRAGSVTSSTVLSGSRAVPGGDLEATDDRRVGVDR